MHTLRRFLFAVLVCLISAYAARAQQAAPSADEDFVRSHYTKYEFRIPMRDGVRLFTAVYVPKASAFAPEAGPSPVAGRNVRGVPEPTARVAALTPRRQPCHRVRSPDQHRGNREQP